MNPYISEFQKTLSHTVVQKNQERVPLYDEGIRLLVEEFLALKRNGAKLFFVGNGGSAAIASHMTADYMKNGGMRTYSLYDNALLTCMGNDYGYPEVFSRPLEFLAGPGDALVAVSSSGNSENILRALETVRQKRGKTITFTGFDPDNRARLEGEVSVYVPSLRYGIVESIHNLILQQIVDEITERDGILL